MVGSTILTLVVIPVLYFIGRRIDLRDEITSRFESSIEENVAVETLWSRLITTRQAYDYPTDRCLLEMVDARMSFQSIGAHHEC